MSAIGFESTFYARLDCFSRSLDHVIMAIKAEPSMANDDDWLHTIELVRTLAANKAPTLAASSVAASLTQRLCFDERAWAQVVAALEKRQLSQDVLQKLDSLAWKLDEERTATLGRMRHGHA
jgi:hypothetical protein